MPFQKVQRKKRVQKKIKYKNNLPKDVKGRIFDTFVEVKEQSRGGGGTLSKKANYRNVSASELTSLKNELKVQYKIYDLEMEIKKHFDRIQRNLGPPAHPNFVGIKRK